MQETKRCTKCHKVKPLSEYYRDKRATDGLHSSCKECHRQLTRDNMRRKRKSAEYRAWEKEYLKRFKRSSMTPEERRAYQRAWYYKNHEHAKRYAREYMRKKRKEAKEGDA